MFSRKAALLELPKTILDSGVLNMQHFDQSYSLSKGFACLDRKTKKRTRL